jgi:hypothetical protein
MSNNNPTTAVPLNHDALSNLLNDLAIVKTVEVVNLAKLSILELLECGLTCKDIGRALSKGVIDFERPLETIENIVTAIDILEAEQYYLPELLNSKVGLTKLGLYILEVTEESSRQQQTPRTVDDLLHHTQAFGNNVSDFSIITPLSGI